MSIWDARTVLITGGTGSFGNALTRLLLETEPRLRSIRIYSRDEFKQSQMQERFDDPRLRFLLGDVRDRERLYRALDGVDIVVHAAAMKQVVAAEYNPIEAVRTNILGTANLVDAALDRGVERVMALSTDKACAPLNLYGATKAVLEKLVVQANSYRGDRTKPLFSAVRYGNVVGSRGSVIPRFLAQRQSGRLTLTDRRMTRFWVSLEEVALWTKGRIEEMAGGELFVPRLPSVRIEDLARAIAPDADLVEVGIRPGEKLHETLITLDESTRAYPHERHYTLAPESPMWQLSFEHWNAGFAPPAFEYRSDTNDRWIDVDEIRTQVGRLQAA